MAKEKITTLSDGRSVRKATKEDLQLVMALIRQGRAKMVQAGNPGQWSGNYPAEETIAHDIDQGDCRLLCEKGIPIATFVVKPGPEPNYRRIDNGSWPDNRPYHVIHRVASADGVHGVMSDIISYCSAFTTSIRIDTHADNRPMLAALSRLGFVYCGIIYVEDGSSRHAYQLLT